MKSRETATAAGAWIVGLLDNGYIELAIRSDHAVAIDCLPPVHKDPVDRLLVAQGTVEGRC
ncbi:hypothetical protein CBM2623_B170401 [Cupriavidus taiwanensis]|nr:hypothetical protein CBM2608_B140468 [Cupriavidus taiwanensis]SPA33357.1 hypothetical protein CBM2623_B170401 [Cupriavidus taiwanensis]